MKKPSISIVVPLFNERESLAELVRLTHAAFSKEKPFEYIFIDDGSTDGSFDELKKLQKKSREPMTVIRLRKRSGKSAALSEGFRFIEGDTVVTLDADLQDDPSEAVKLTQALSEHTDLIVGWRKHRKDSTNKLHVSHIFNWVVSVAYGVNLHDMNCGLKVMKADVAREINLYGELHRFIPVLAKAKGFTVTEMPVTHHARKFGSSKFGFERIFAAFDLLTTLFLYGFGTRPILVFGTMGAVMVLMGGVALFYLTALHFMGHAIGTRPLLLLAVMFILFGLQLLSTGLLGELITSSSIGKRRAPVAQVLSPYAKHTT